MEITNYEGLILQNEIIDLLKEDVNLRIKYKLTKLLESVSNELKTFETFRTQTVTENTINGLVDTVAVQNKLEPLAMERITINYSISLDDISAFSSSNVPQVLFKFVSE
jgi:hypothetical protein